jgi:protein-S-isoprenylcysteine O-methyltransferase Ste14
VSRLPTLGPRGEGWVLLQFVLIGLVALSDFFVPLRITWLAGSISWLPGLGLIAIGIGIAIRGYFDLEAAKAFTAFPYPRPDASLVEVGAYRVVRHPLYAGLILGGVGLALIRTSWTTLIATAGLFVILDLKRRREEAWLAERFPGYDAYRRRTHGLIPFLY